MSSVPSVHIFVTPGDIRSVVARVECRVDIHSVRCGLFDDPERPAIRDLSRLADLGLAKTGTAVLEPAFLIVNRGRQIEIRSVPQRRGGIKYAVNQLANPGSIVVRPGGRFSESVLIAGSIGTVHNDLEAKALMAAFRNELRKFHLVKGLRIGPEAMRMFSAGARLTADVWASGVHDLAV